jgi:hypothetical protein
MSIRFPTNFGRLVAVLTLCGIPGASLQRDTEAEDQLKSAVLLTFVQNARWAAPSALNTPLTVGVIGRPAMFRWLRTSLDGKVVEGRTLRVVEVKLPPEPQCCQVIYFATEKQAEIKPFLLAPGSEHALTVGESDRFLEYGGAVNLFLVDGHMAFEVSLGVLTRSGIDISSKLLRFGQIRDLAKGRPVK